jgi:hypothetical protein
MQPSIPEPSAVRRTLSMGIDCENQVPISDPLELVTFHRRHYWTLKIVERSQQPHLSPLQVNDESK